MRETSPLILMQLQIVNIYSVLYLICKTSQWNTYKQNTMIKQSKDLSGDLKPEHKKTTIRTTMSPTTDIDSQVPSTSIINK